MFQGSLAVAIILIDSREKPNPQLGFELRSLHVIEKRNNVLIIVLPGKQTLLKQKGTEKLMKVTRLTAHFQTQVEDRA